MYTFYTRPSSSSGNKKILASAQKKKTKNLQHILILSNPRSSIIETNKKRETPRYLINTEIQQVPNFKFSFNYYCKYVIDEGIKDLSLESSMLLKAGNSCYYSVQTLLSSRLFSFLLKIIFIKSNKAEIIQLKH